MGGGPGCRGDQSPRGPSGQWGHLRRPRRRRTRRVLHGGRRPRHGSRRASVPDRGPPGARDRHRRPGGGDAGRRDRLPGRRGTADDLRRDHGRTRGGARHRHRRLHRSDRARQLRQPGGRCMRGQSERSRPSAAVSAYPIGEVVDLVEAAERYPASKSAAEWRLRLRRAALVGVPALVVALLVARRRGRSRPVRSALGWTAVAVLVHARAHPGAVRLQRTCPLPLRPAPSRLVTASEADTPMQRRRQPVPAGQSAVRTRVRGPLAVDPDLRWSDPRSSPERQGLWPWSRSAAPCHRHPTPIRTQSCASPARSRPPARRPVRLHPSAPSSTPKARPGRRRVRSARSRTSRARPPATPPLPARSSTSRAQPQRRSCPVGQVPAERRCRLVPAGTDRHLRRLRRRDRGDRLPGRHTTAAEGSTSLSDCETPATLAVAYSNLDGIDGYDDSGTDVLIAKLVDTNLDGRSLSTTR